MSNESLLFRCSSHIVTRLSHVVWGPHDHNFQALWDELRAEHQSLLAKGYSGEGFLSKGHKLGGRQIPLVELRRQARAAAEKRQVLHKGSGQKLGGTPVQRGADMRQVIADAALRRTAITKGCSTGTREADSLAEQARRNGFRTKAEEDDANNMAIANALVELMEEEEAGKLNGTYKPSPSEGLSWTRENGLELEQPKPRSPVASSTQSPPALPAQRPAPNQVNRGGRPVSRLVAEDEAHRNSKSPSHMRSYSTFSYTPNPSTSTSSSLWACPICTLENPLTSLYCDACETEKPSNSSSAPSKPVVGDSSRNQTAPEGRSKASLGWNCHWCGSFMESKWWTCSMCGTMKVSS